VNPEAVRRQKSLSLPELYREAWALQMDRAACVLSRGTLGGDVLSPSIRKSLMAMTKPRGMLINPFSDSQDAQDMTKKTLTGPELRRMSRAKLKSLLPDEYDEETQAQMKALIGDDDDDDDKEIPEFGEDEKDGEEAAKPKAKDVPQIKPKGEQKVATADPEEAARLDKELAESDEEVKTDGEVAGEAGEPTAESTENGSLKLGAKVLREAHDALDYVINYLEEALGPVENEPVKAGLQTELGHLTDLVDTVRGIYTAAYPDMPALGVEPSEGEDDVLSRQMKSMLGSSESRQFRVLGIQSLVSQVTDAKNLTANQRKSLLAVEQKLNRMLESAATFKPEPPAGYVPKDQFDALANRFDQLLSKFEAVALPASK
jgi:hypothetical protein